MRFVLFNLVVGATLAYLILADRWRAEDLPVAGSVSPETQAAQTKPAEVASAPDPVQFRGATGGPPLIAADTQQDQMPPPQNTEAASPEREPNPGGSRETGTSGDMEERVRSDDNLPRKLRELARAMEGRFLAGMK